MGGGGGKQESSTKVEPWKPAEGALKNILSQAEQLYNKNGGLNAEWINKEIADLTPEMQDSIKSMLSSPGMDQLLSEMNTSVNQGTATIGQAASILGNLSEGGGSITGDKINALTQDLYKGDIVNAQVDALKKDVQEGLDYNLNRVNQQATQTGNMGSSRAGVASGVAMGKAAEALTSGSAAIRNSALQNAQNTAQSILQGNQQSQLNSANALGSLGTSSANANLGMLNAYNTMQQNQFTGAQWLQEYNQNQKNAEYYNATGAQNAGLNNLLNYLNIAGSISSQGGIQNVQGAGADRLGQVMGAGAMLGSAYMMSDRRLKANIVIVEPAQVVEDEQGEPHNVPAVCSWDWNDNAKELFAIEGFEVIPPAYGVIAQELEELGLEAFVVEHPCDLAGFDGSVKLVNYPALIDYAKHLGLLKDEVEA